jgi:molecular chaperone GrpE
MPEVWVGKGSRMRVFLLFHCANVIFRYPYKKIARGKSVGYTVAMNKKNDNTDAEFESMPENMQDSEQLDDSVVAEENAAEALKKLREKLKKAEAEKQEYLTGWQRAKADMVNANKRHDEERKEFAKYANENLIADLIPTLDSFDMAMGNKEAWEKVDKNWRMGVEYIYSQLIRALSDNGLKELNPMGETYDPAHHEAVSYEPVADEKSDHKIIQVIQKGYSLNGKVLKVPKVKVGEFKA